MVCKVLTLGVQSQRIKENLKRVAWGLDVGHEDQDKSLVFAIVIFSVI